MDEVSLRHISMAFGPTLALDDVTLQLAAGEVHALAGANGAGKSTLIKILSGVYDDYSGELCIAGQPVRFAHPVEARRAGIATIHQELSLVGNLSIADNLLLSLQAPAWRIVSRDAARKRARAVLAELGLNLDVDVAVEQFPLALRQRIEIARALADKARVVIMDEPTSALSQPDAEQLFASVERLRAQGTAILYISHRMEELYRLADRISVLRDGRLVCSATPAELDRSALLRAMVGRDLEPTAARTKSAEQQPRLQVKTLGLTIHAGEIVGVAGLHGSGARDLLWRIAGAEGPGLPNMVVDGAAYQPCDPHQAIAAGVALLTGDRSRGIVLPMSVTHSTSLSCLARFGRLWIDQRAEREAASTITQRLHLAAPSLDAPLSQLSGGNQQKVALARCLQATPHVLLLDEPTRGIDVAAKVDVHEQILELAGQGTAVLWYASELDELLAHCDRIIVLARSQQVAEFGSDASRAEILSAAMGAA